MPDGTPSDTGLAERLAAVRASIAAACARAGRSTEAVRLIAVSKTHPASVILEAVACGQVDFGENRVEEAGPKIAEVERRSAVPLNWHMIGHIQSRKARDVIAAGFGLAHSVDSLKLAERLSRFVAEAGCAAFRILLEVNISGEAQKAGFDGFGWEHDPAKRAALYEAVRTISQLPNLDVIGLMTMAPLVENAEAARPFFAGLRRLRDALAEETGLPLSHLSMGMTDDYPVAIEEGATLVRIGRAIFGERA